jgi:two-component system, NarL family, nitrate/nitrite response regulator NarL
MRPFYYPKDKILSLTAREKEVMSLIVTGLLNKEIADTLGIRIQTVCNTLHIIYIKLNVKNRVEAVNQFRNLHPATTGNNIETGIRA